MPKCLICKTQMELVEKKVSKGLVVEESYECPNACVEDYKISVDQPKIFLN